MNATESVLAEIETLKTDPSVDLELLFELGKKALEAKRMAYCERAFLYLQLSLVQVKTA